MEIFAFHPMLKKWVEIGNSGMFRPEMLEPMGFPKDVRVHGWGLSLERPTMIRLAPIFYLLMRILKAVVAKIRNQQYQNFGWSQGIYRRRRKVCCCKILRVPDDWIEAQSNICRRIHHNFQTSTLLSTTKSLSTPPTVPWD